jgi:FtsP/CotA-like multicopper oxidase with cupredoxin domain/peroxiredoxin
MLPTLSRPRRVALALVPWLLLGWGRPAHSQDRPGVDVYSKKAILQRTVPFQAPPELAQLRKGKEVEIELAVWMMEHKIDANQDGKLEVIRTRSYNGQLCGPVIRVRPGDLLKVTLRNNIPVTEPDTPFDPEHPNVPHAFNVTNLHTHGLNVSPEGRSDNVSLELGPGEYRELCFDLHDKHTCGTMWYHAHKHGSVALQLAGGMAGVLIVEGGMDEVPEIKAMKEHIAVFQQLPYGVKDGEVSPKYVYATPAQKEAWEKAGELVRNTLINGVLQPTIEMRPGEVRRIRCVHAGLEESLNLGLALEKYTNPTNDQLVSVYEIAVDGLPLGRKQERKRVLLQPGYRSDLLLKAPLEEGEYLLRNLPLDASLAFNRVGRKEEKYLARLRVTGKPVEKEMKLPKDEDLARYRLPSVEDSELVRRDVEVHFFLYEDDKEFTVNGKAYVKNQIVDVPKPKLGTAEEWTLYSDAGGHPFHIHVNPFEVIRVDAEGRGERVWRDTLFLNDTEAPVKIRSRFENYAGKTVLHCHNLRHEDQGMMMGLEIVGTGKKTRCPPAPEAGLRAGQAAPAWVLPDAAGRQQSWADHNTKRVLLVCSRGQECMHCREQLLELKKHRAALKGAGLFVVVVVPVAAAKLPREQEFADLLLADEALEAFRKFRCHDGRALHGTFLIEEGKVSWRHAGDDPYLDIRSFADKAKSK